MSSLDYKDDILQLLDELKDSATIQWVNCIAWNPIIFQGLGIDVEDLHDLLLHNPGNVLELSCQHKDRYILTVIDQNKHIQMMWRFNETIARLFLGKVLSK